jgi:hypothetical protein
MELSSICRLVDKMHRLEVHLKKLDGDFCLPSNRRRRCHLFLFPACCLVILAAALLFMAMELLVYLAKWFSRLSTGAVQKTGIAMAKASGASFRRRGETA